MIRRTTSVSVLVVGLLLPGAGTAPAVPASTAAVATDQPCTRQASAGSVLQRVPFRADDLPAMTLAKSALGSGVTRYETDWLSYGYLDNAELPRVRLGPANWCSLNRTYGRITGFSRGFVAAQAVWTTSHVFFSASDAAAWLSHYVAGMKALPGHAGVTSVRATSLGSTLGSGAVRIAVGSRRGPSTSVLFRRGQVVGEVYDGGPPGSPAVVDVVAAAKKLATAVSDRIALVTHRSADVVDLVVQMSAGLPKSSLGPRYAGLAWDWFYGGCWDVAEAASQTDTSSAAASYKKQAAKFGQLTYCRAMYSAPPGKTVNGIERAFTGGTLYRTAAGAHGAVAQTMADWKARAGRTVAGTAYGPVTRLRVGRLGDEVLGLQQKAGSVVLTRVLVRHGRYVAVAALNARSFSAMTADVERWASALDRRVAALLATRSA